MGHVAATAGTMEAGTYERYGILRRVSARQAVVGWDSYADKLQTVIDRVNAAHDTDAILAGIQSGAMQLWDIDGGRGVCVTEIQDFPRYRQLLVLMVAGTASADWLADGQEALEGFARNEGCTHMALIGRPGWRRACEALGYGRHMVFMQKDLGNGDVLEAADHDDK